MKKLEQIHEHISLAKKDLELLNRMCQHKRQKPTKFDTDNRCRDCGVLVSRK